MIDFSTLQGLTIPEGVVTQIADAAGNVLWAVQSESGEPIVLEVAKVTATTYAASTSYTDEQFVLLDIYPKTASSRVEVTYGGLTKTLTFNGTNAQQVFFGTFNGASDSVATPTSGTLTIEGGCKGIAVGTYKKMNTTTNKSSTYYCSCITAVTEWGGITSIPAYAFYECSKLALTELPSGITSIGSYAFYYCKTISISEIPEGVTSIGDYAFTMKSYKDDKENTIVETSMYKKSITLPSTIISIGSYAFCAYALYTGYLIEYVILATNPPTLGENSLPMSTYRSDYIVPTGCGEAYKTAEGWSDYANYIKEAS